MPELVSTLCTFLVLSPLVLTPGLGQFLFKPMAMAVAFSMIAAYFLSRTLVPGCSAFWLKGTTVTATATATARPRRQRPRGLKLRARDVHDQRQWQRPAPRAGSSARSSGPSRRWEQMIDYRHRLLRRGLDFVLRTASSTIIVGFGMLGDDPRPHVADHAAATSSPRSTPAPSRCTSGPPAALASRTPRNGSRRSRTSSRRPSSEEDLQLVLSEIGVTADWSAAYTPNSGPMDAVVKIQLSRRAASSAQEYVHMLRTAFAADPKFNDLEFAFDAGGMVRSAMNEGKSTPISIRVTGKNQKVAHKIATAIKNEVTKIDGRRRRPGHPATQLSPVPAHGRPDEGRRRWADPGRRHAERRRRVQLEHLVQQAQFLDRSHEQEPVFRGRPVPGEGHHVDRHPAGHPGHDPAPGLPKRPIPLRNVVQLDARPCRPRSRTTTSSRRSS